MGVRFKRRRMIAARDRAAEAAVLVEPGALGSGDVAEPPLAPAPVVRAPAPDMPVVPDAPAPAAFDAQEPAAQAAVLEAAERDAAAEAVREAEAPAQPEER
jgi:hypothetical protein